MNRGRKPIPCPDTSKLRALHADDPRPIVIARRFAGNAKQIRRWLGELGIQLPPRRTLRPRGVTPAFARLAYRPDGKRITCTLYNIWHSMRLRCLTPGYRDYKYYGGRGITICAEWDTYEAFRAWAISHGFGKDLTLDRREVNGNYEPSNCRWIPQSDQQLNTRRVKMLTVNGVTKPLPVWSRETGLSPEVIRVRLKAGWDHESCVTIPVGSLPRGRGQGLKSFLGSRGR